MLSSSFRRQFLVLACAGIAIRGSLDAGPGDLDLSFNGVGYRRVEFPRGTDIATAAAAQSDGKVVVVGRTGSTQHEDFFICRFNADGALDGSFGTGGKTITRASLYPNGATGVRIQPDGKFVVSGYSWISPGYDGESVAAVIRYNSDGSLDETFGGGGVRFIFAAGANVANGVALQADGKIVLAGTTGTLPNTEFGLIRLHPDGDLDASFDGDGMVSTSFGNDQDAAEAVVIQPDGKIVAAGWSVGLNHRRIVLARYNGNGSPDSDFDGDGKVITDLGSNARALSLAIHNQIAQFRLVVAGYRGSASYFGRSGVVVDSGDPASQMVVLRYRSSGERDDTFDDDGVAYADFPAGSESVAQAVVVQGTVLNASYLAAGFTGAQSPGSGADLQIALARFTTSGSPDSSLGGDGTVTGPARTDDRDLGFAAVVQSGKITVVGVAQATGREFDLALHRFEGDGTVDPVNANVIVDVGKSRSIALDVKLQGDGKIVAAGLGSASMGLARMAPTGELDSSFDSDGLVLAGFPTTLGFSSAQAVALSGDTMVVAAENFEHPDSRIGVARFLPHGSLDSSFNGDGRLTTQVGGDDRGYDILSFAGKIYVAGTAAQPLTQTDDFVLARYDLNGSLEDLTVTQIADWSSATALAVQPGGQIVVAGTAGDDNLNKMVVARYSSGGSGLIDTSFGENGVATIDFPDNASASDMTVGAGGAIIIVGNSEGRGIVARLTANGDPDPTFTLDGIASPLPDVTFRAVAVQSDGKILVGGSSGNRAAIVRYQHSGTRDMTYGVDGIAEFALGTASPGFSPEIHAVAVDAFDRAVVAGEVDGHMVVARVTGDLSYALWAELELSGFALADRLPEANPDHDSLDNKLEYLLAANPRVMTPDPLEILFRDGQWELVFYTRRVSPGVVPLILTSPGLQLGSWVSPAQGSFFSTNLGDSKLNRFVPAPNGAPSRFFGLAAQLAPAP